MKPVGWGILGTGTIARKFAHGLQLVPHAQLLAVGSRTRETAGRFARELAVPRAYSSYEELANDPDIDIVYIATTNNRHAANCMLCLNAGKAVLCEKPFALSARQAREVIALARHKRLFCMEAMWMHFIPAMQRMRSLIERGAIGDIQLLRAELGFPNIYDGRNRFFNPELGGGALLDLGVYPVSLATQLLGVPGEIMSRATIGPTGVDEQAGLLLSYEDGRLAIISTSLRSLLGNDAVVVGSRGQLHIHAPLFAPVRLTLRQFTTPAEPAQPRFKLLSAAKHSSVLRNLYRRYEPVIAPLLGRGGKQISVPFSGNGYNYEAAEATRCVKNGATESKLMPLDQTLRTIEVLDRARDHWRSPALA